MMFSPFKPLAFAALTFSGQLLDAAEKPAPTPVEDFINQGLDFNLNISEEAKEKFPRLSELIEVAVQQNKSEHGLSKEDAITFRGLIRILTAADLRKEDLDKKSQAKILAMDNEQFDQFCIENGIKVSFCTVLSENTNRYYLSDISLSKIKKSDKLTAAAEQLIKSQQEKFTALGFRYPALASPVAYLEEKKLLTDGSCTAATVIETTKKDSVLVMDPAAIQTVIQSWPDEAKSNFINGTIANELAHIRNEAIYKNRNPLEKLSVDIGDQTLNVIWVECNEAFSDLATTLQSEDNITVAFHFSQCLAGRQGRYRLSDMIQMQVAATLLKDDELQKLKILAGQFNKSRNQKDYDQLQAACVQTISQRPKFRQSLIDGYIKSLKDLK